ncbi:hypothetical protein L1887_56620 [Cichorium endivia]|nr:hypothetical protein L1887_56620 [Cichorium endivia]
MPSIESIGAISSLGGRAIDSSCPWLVKGMRGVKSRGISCAKQRQVRASKEGKWQGISKKKKEEKAKGIAKDFFPHSHQIGGSSGTIESLKLRNSRISQELNKLFYATGQERPSLKLREAIPLENRRCKSIQIDRGVPNQQQALSNVLGEGSAAEAKKSNQCSFRAQPKDPILAAAGALDGTGKTVHE